jgi:hypothetical protein
MKRKNQHAVRSVIAAVSVVALALLAGVSSAADLVSASFLLRGGTLSGGGEVALQSTASTPTIGSGGVTIGQPGPIGVSTGPTSGITLHAGFWPIMAGENGVPDFDADGLLDAFDNCMDIANGPDFGICYSGGVQVDDDGDGYGNPCDGDFNNDNAVNSSDVVVIGPDLGSGLPTPGTGTDMNCDGAVNSSDVVLFGPQLGRGAPGP